MSKLRFILLLAVAIALFITAALPAFAANYQESNVLDELDPFSSNIDQQLEKLDREYRAQTNRRPWMERLRRTAPTNQVFSGCYRGSCKVYAHVRRSDQRLYLTVEGNSYAEWPVSTGAAGHETPNFDRHPNGRIYDQYTSTTFPGGNYKGLGNMPYAVFIEGGFAVHGTSAGNWKYLGRPASHGCIRVHPDNGLIFNQLVRQYGAQNVWIQVD